MGNINDSLSHCEFDLFNNYELDWFSEKTWNITSNLDENSYKLIKGKFILETNKLFEILFSKKIEKIKNIKNLKINLNLDFNLNQKFYLNIYINNEDFKKKILIEKIIINNEEISFSKSNNNYEKFNLETNKFTVLYNLNFTNTGIIISNKNFNDLKNHKKIIFDLSYDEPIFINIEVFNKNISDNINYFKLNI